MKKPLWSYLLFPHLAGIFFLTYLAASNHLHLAILKTPGADKLGHFILYGALALFSVGYFGRDRWKNIAAVLAALATLEEYSQSWFPARTFDLLDLAATLAGIVLFAHAAGAKTISSPRTPADLRLLRRLRAPWTRLPEGSAKIVSPNA